MAQKGREGKHEMHTPGHFKSFPLLSGNPVLNTRKWRCLERCYQRTILRQQKESKVEITAQGKKIADR